MENYNFSGCEVLSLDEIMAIEGGSAYDAGYAVGEAIREFFRGFADGISGK